MRLLFVASSPLEFRGLLPALTTQEKFAAGVRWSRRGRLNGYEVLLIANGVGWRQAAAAVDAACADFRPDAVISTGFCGALDPDLGIADAVVGTCVAAPERRFAVTPVTAKKRCRTGIVSSIDHVATTAAEKSALRAQGGSIVEMEAAGIAERAEALGLRFYCVRAVTDLAGEGLANNFNEALRSAGYFDTMLIFRHALRHPVARLPELIRLRQNCNRAARTLGDFLADCQF
jgi:adenosylhomocysteine nucleosidase